MIARHLHRLQVEKGALSVTSYAGLPLLTELAHQTGVIKALDDITGLWRRQGEYQTSDYVISLALTLIAGGEGLDDTRLLRADEGLRRLVLADMPAANSHGRFLRRFTHRTIHHLGRAATGLALKNLPADGPITVDIDASLIESDKKAAKTTYKGFDGYNPVLAWLAEADVFVGGVFRDGNASPQCHLLSLLRYCGGCLPPGREVRVRSDSAGYRLDLIELCLRRNWCFTIAADLDAAVREAIDAVPEKDWRLVVKGDNTFLLAETIHVPGASGTGYALPAFRLVVKRYLSGQLELFKDPIEYHAIISNLPETFTSEQVLEHYNGRGAMEKAIGELKNGYGLTKLPCAELLPNAAYFQVALLAYNLIRTFKRCALPDGWKSFCVKNLRFRLLNQAALVISHARRLTLKLSAEFPFFGVFEQARWGVLSPQFG